MKILMTTRAQQYEETRRRIIDAAVEAFSELGFHGASTREIAARAGANQGLITYHFRSKDELWKAAADRIFNVLRTTLRLDPHRLASDDRRERARETIRQYVRFVAAHPELFRLMVEEGKSADDRMEWLVDTHLKPIYAGFERILVEYVPGLERAMVPHAFYALAGASSLLFAVGPECRRLAGLNPTRKQTVEAHAEFISRLFVP
jgi:TetR/AcrR family transcriptional regulator